MEISYHPIGVPANFIDEVTIAKLWLRMQAGFMPADDRTPLQFIVRSLQEDAIAFRERCRVRL